MSNNSSSRVELIEKRLAELVPENGYPANIFQAMRYSLLAGGKRIRPIFFMAAADAVGADGTNFIDAACALEMIHTYSLIHDDLPAMDNDDYRRGRLTNHKVFGEGMAILAGDGLLTLAFQTLIRQQEINAAVLNKIVDLYATAAGPIGMVGGQAIDLASAGGLIAETDLLYMHKAKTSELFRAALVGGALAAGANTLQIEAMQTFAELFGLAFQITDDILDVTSSFEELGKPIGSDEKNAKPTYVSKYGLSGARQMANDAVAQAIASLSIFGERADLLRVAAQQLLTRRS
ncbi:MAG: polyprenyl synthetase family protein [Negativicutes bacterium]|jgi:geranylgeranyl diphosphate synthase type II